MDSDGSTSLALHWPLSYLGEAYRCSKNVTAMSFIYMNLLGSPLMYVWRDDPDRLTVSVPPVLLREGVPEDITVTVTDGSDPVGNATVCIWKKNEVFALADTDEQGRAFFPEVCIADGSGDVDLVVTAAKRRLSVNQAETTTVDYIPGRLLISVLPSDVPIVALDGFSVDPDGDGTANPGESVDILLSALNSGGMV